MRLRAAEGLRPGLAALRHVVLGHMVAGHADRAGSGAALRADALAGLTVAAYLIPQVLAYAEVAGLPAVAGLWAAAAAIIAYAVAGSSRLLSLGPESTTAVMTAIAIAPLAGGDPGRYAALAAALALLVGAICLVAGVAGLGFLAALLSRPVLVGYLAGIAVTMMVSQLGNVTGVDVDDGTPIAGLISFVRHLDQVHLPTLLLAAAVLAIVLTAGALAPRAPGPLIAVLLASVLTAVLGAQQLGVEVVGAVPVGLPAPALPDVRLADLTSLLLPAAGVSLVAFSDDVLTARAFAARRGHDVDAGRELVALGAANAAAGLVSGFPVSSSGSRTAIADAGGARSQLYGLVALVAVVAVLLVGGPVLAAFPTAALGALVVYAATRLIEPGEFRRFASFSGAELALAVATTAAVVGVGVLTGVLVAVGLSILDLLRKVSRPHDGVLGFVPGLAGMHDVDDYPQATTVPGLVVYRYDAPLCFANADDFRRRALAAVSGAEQPVRWLVLNMEAVVQIDITAADTMRELCQHLHRHGVVVALARVKQELLVALRRGGILGVVGENRIYPTLPTAVEAFRAAHRGVTPTADE